MTYVMKTRRVELVLCSCSFFFLPCSVLLDLISIAVLSFSFGAGM